MTTTDAVWRNSRSRGGARLVLLAIADNCPPGNRPVTRMAVAALMQQTALSRRAVQAAVRELEHLGELRVERGPGPRSPNQQTITLTEAGPVVPDLAAEEARRARRRAVRSRTRVIWDRDGWTCQVRGENCTGHKYLTIGHKISIEDGGADDDDNLQTECETCNKAGGPR